MWVFVKDVIIESNEMMFLVSDFPAFFFFVECCPKHLHGQ